MCIVRQRIIFLTSTKLFYLHTAYLFVYNNDYIICYENGKNVTLKGIYRIKFITVYLSFFPFSEYKVKIKCLCQDKNKASLS